MNPARARLYAQRRWPRSIGFQTAYLDGYAKGRAGRPVDLCPYLVGRRGRAHPGWRPAWRAAWIAGYNAGRARR